MIKVLKTGNRFDLLSNLTILDKLEKGNYEFKATMSGTYLEKVQDSKAPEKVYSNDKDFIEHVIKTWNNLQFGNLGVALVGKKGLGKSFTGNQIIERLDLPVIRVTPETNTDVLLSFLSKIEEDYVIFIDEFEKLFATHNHQDDSRTSQENLLSFLDGSGGKNNKILFLITANEENKINSFLKDRPSRLRYFRKYEKLEDNLIQEIAKDLLENQDYAEDLIKHLPYKGLNMDALICIIKEINLHDKPYSEFKEFFNFIGEDTAEIKIYAIEDNNKVLIKTLSPHRSIFEHDRIFNYAGHDWYSEETINIYEEISKEIELYNWSEDKEGNDVRTTKKFFISNEFARIQNLVF